MVTTSVREFLKIQSDSCHAYQEFGDIRDLGKVTRPPGNNDRKLEVNMEYGDTHVNVFSNVQYHWHFLTTASSFLRSIIIKG